MLRIVSFITIKRSELFFAHRNEQRESARGEKGYGTELSEEESSRRSLTDAAKEARRASTSSRKDAGDLVLLLKGQL